MRIDLDALQELLNRAGMPVLEYAEYTGGNAEFVVKWSNGAIRPIKGSFNLVFEWPDYCPRRHEIRPGFWIIMEVIDGKRKRVFDVLNTENGCHGIYGLDYQLAEWRGANGQQRSKDERGD
jgi:hypothetical protein